MLTQETLLKDLWNPSISLLNYLYVHGSWKKIFWDSCLSFAEVTFIVPQHVCLSSCLNNSTDNDGPCYQTGFQPSWFMILCIFFFLKNHYAIHRFLRCILSLQKICKEYILEEYDSNSILLDFLICWYTLEFLILFYFIQ